MFAQMTNGLEFQSKALVLRAERQRVIASNIANADTPGYAARDINFKEAMASALGSGGMLQTSTSTTSLNGLTNSRHIALTSGSGTLGVN